MSSSHSHRYSNVFDCENESIAITPPRSSLFKSKYVITMLCIISSVMGFITARLTEFVAPDASNITSTVPKVFEYNRSFSYPPSEHTNRAWDGLFPSQGGFFTDPTIAPSLSTFSVFHQIHCVDAIRKGYWASHTAALKGERLIDGNLPMHIQESHVRHCIDLIRQSLMCLGDTTVEVVDKQTDGVTGFGTLHQCRDWEQLVKWVHERQKIKDG